MKRTILNLRCRTFTFSGIFHYGVLHMNAEKNCNQCICQTQQTGKVGQCLPSHLIALLGFLLLEGRGLLSSSDSQNDIRSYKYAVLLLMIVKISKIILVLICLSPTLSKHQILIHQSDTYTLNTNGTISRNFSL